MVSLLELVEVRAHDGDHDQEDGWKPRPHARPRRQALELETDSTARAAKATPTTPPPHPRPRTRARTLPTYPNRPPTDRQQTANTRLTRRETQAGAQRQSLISWAFAETARSRQKLAPPPHGRHGQGWPKMGEVVSRPTPANADGTRRASSQTRWRFVGIFA